jgi:uncharacterized protein YggE
MFDGNHSAIMVWLNRICAVAFWIALSSMLAPVPPVHAQGAQIRTITVTGEGRADGAPDQAEITGGVVTEAATAAEAVTANTVAMNQVFATLEGIGVPLARIQTADFSVQPVFAQRQNTDVLRVTGYRVSNQVRVRVEQMALIGTILDALVRSGANQLHGISFGMRDARPLAETARRGAVLDAAAKAKTIAEAAGVRLGPIQSVQEGGGGGPIPVMRMAAQAEMAVPVAPGELTVRVSVTVTYAIE